MAVFKGTGGEDDYTLLAGTREFVRLLGGNDILRLGAAALDKGDRIDAGAGVDDQVFLQNGGTYVFGHNHLVNFESMSLFGKGAFTVKVDDTVAAAGTTFAVFGGGSAVDRFHPASLSFNGAAERDAKLLVYATEGKDTLVGGALADEFHARAGDDVLTGGRGGDLFVFEGDNDKGDIWGKDVITDFQDGQDHILFTTTSVDSVRDLIITDSADGAVIRTPNSTSSVTLTGVFARDLDANDITVTNNPGFVQPHHDAVPTLPDHGLLV